MVQSEHRSAYVSFLSRILSRRDTIPFLPPLSANPCMFKVQEVAILECAEKEASFGGREREVRKGLAQMGIDARSLLHSLRIKGYTVH